MRVINGTPGEMFDRLTVVHLKLEFGAKHGVDLTNWVDEKDELEAELEGCIGVSKDYTSVRNLVNELKVLNRFIWQALDQQHEYVKLNLEEISVELVRDVARLGLIIMLKNDLRAKLIGEINELYGLSHQEKIPHQTSTTASAGGGPLGEPVKPC